MSVKTAGLPVIKTLENLLHLFKQAMKYQWIKNMPPPE